MYAIRSYYGPCFTSRATASKDTCATKGVWMNKETTMRRRITSYNVCYTKLLRTLTCLMVSALDDWSWPPQLVNRMLAKIESARLNCLNAYFLMVFFCFQNYSVEEGDFLICAWSDGKKVWSEFYRRGHKGKRRWCRENNFAPSAKTLRLRG